MFVGDIKLPAFIDLTGQKFGKLVVIKQVSRDKNGNVLWLCLCSCGEETVVRSSNLRNSNTKSCGCLQKEHVSTHGQYKTKIYNIWHDMTQRCRDPNNKYYGKRKIIVCYRWSNKNPKGFENFYKDVGNPPPGKSLDRINNNKGYNPGNWRWATRKEQSRNMRSNINISFEEGFLCLRDYCKKLNLNYGTIISRISRGRTIEEAITTPIRKYKRRSR